MRIVFMGTPDFAEASLEKLIDENKEIAAVFTQPDKPKGRGMQLVASPVKVLAQKYGIPVYQPETFKDGSATELLKTLQPDLLVVVAYGKILPQAFLDVPKFGAINLHGSLLPKYRGAAPIQWAVLNGDLETGVSVQYMTFQMDAGDVIASQTTQIGEFETSGELFDRLMILGADLLNNTVDKIAAGKITRIPQKEEDATFTKMLDKSMCPIDWNHSPRQIIKQICGLHPWPLATAVINGEEMKIHSAAYSDVKTMLAPGKIVSADKNGITFSCADGQTLCITELQPAGKKRMSAGAYLLGHMVLCDE